MAIYTLPSPTTGTFPIDDNNCKAIIHICIDDTHMHEGENTFCFPLGLAPFPVQFPVHPSIRPSRRADRDLLSEK